MRNTIFDCTITGRFLIAKTPDETHEILANHCSFSSISESFISNCAISAVFDKNLVNIEEVDNAESTLAMVKKKHVNHISLKIFFFC